MAKQPFYLKEYLRFTTRVIAVTFVSGLLIFFGCRTPQTCCNHDVISQEIFERTSHDLITNSCPGAVSLPPDVVLEDGLTEGEAIAIALWNNPGFLATLSNLGIARGDLVQAGLLTNPQLSLLFPPIGSKQLEWTLFVPIESIILRSRRIEIAERDLQRICNELVQNGLNVARDARLAFADFQFAIDRHELAQEAVEVRVGIADLANKRLLAGDIGELEAVTARIDANRTRAEAAGLEHAVKVAEANLKNVLGIVSVIEPLTPVSREVPIVVEIDTETLANSALETRPDVKAARIAVEAAEHRVELARKSYLQIEAIADGNSGGAGPTNAGPGIRFQIPIFNKNEGLVLRSQWTVDQARHNYQSIKNRVVTDVRMAAANVEQANANLQLLRSNVLTDLEDVVNLSAAAYRDGAETYFVVLQSTGLFIDSKIQELQLLADVRRSVAELDRSVGRRVSFSAPINNIAVSKNVLPVPYGAPSFGRFLTSSELLEIQQKAQTTQNNSLLTKKTTTAAKSMILYHAGGKSEKPDWNTSTTAFK